MNPDRDQCQQPSTTGARFSAIGIGVVALATAVTATPSIVYDLPRYNLDGTALGHVNFILANGG